MARVCRDTAVMIRSSPLIMMALDVAIIVILAIAFFVLTRTGFFEKGATPRNGRVLILIGVAVAGLFYLADLLVMALLPRYVGEQRAMEIMTFLHLEAEWFISLTSLVLIVTGMIIFARQRQEIESTILRNAQRVERVQHEIVQSELRFRSLIEQTKDAVYCFEYDPPMPKDLPLDEQIEFSKRGVLVECNQEFAKSVGVESIPYALGLQFGDLDSAKDTRSHAGLIRAFVENNYQLNSYDLNYKSVDGDDRSLLVNFTGVLEGNQLVRIWGAEIDVLAQRQTDAALKSRREFQDFVAGLSSRLITINEDKPDSALVECLAEVSNFLDADRARIFWYDSRKMTIELEYFWNQHGGAPVMSVSMKTFPWIASRILSGQSVRLSANDAMPSEAAEDLEQMHALELTSIVASPLIVSADSVGVLAFGNIADDREWIDQDMTELRVVADLFASVVGRINARKALNVALAELRDAKERLEAENVYLRQEISTTHGFDEICGESPQLRQCLHQVQQVAGTTTSVLIQGETGTGKELIARAIHERSLRKDRPLVKVNCAALPSNLIESELFGHEKGAFTGAHARKRGRFDLAHMGTLFLDEIGDFPLELQGKLLRVIQEGEFQRLGGTDNIEVDVRLIAATNRDLQQAVDNGEFRADLYYRINTFPINLPKLVDREGDIPILAEHIVKKQAALLGKDVSAISATMMEHLQSYSWPGNIRELESVIQRALISSDGPVLEASEFVATLTESEKVVSNVPATGSGDLSAAERLHIEEVLSQARWVIGGAEGAAKKLGIPPSTLRSKMKKLGIHRPTPLG
ncbi:MAG: sigma 54-interacting transcriptional regulator [Woeseiaceae bacterium]